MSSPTINLNPITKKGIRQDNLSLDRIYKGKKEEIPRFTPISSQSEHSVIKTLFEKAHSSRSYSQKPCSQWIGRVGSACGMAGIDVHTYINREKKKLNLDAILKKIAFDCYQEFSRGLSHTFAVPKTRLSNQPILEGNKESLRVMVKINPEWKEFSQAQTHDLEGNLMSFIDFIASYHRPPESLLTDDGELVPLQGFMSLLAIGRILADTDILGAKGRNTDFIWVKDYSGKVTHAETVKIDTGQPFQFTAQRNSSSQKTDGNDLNTLKNLEIPQDDANILVKWSALTSKQQETFLQTLFNSTRYFNSGESKEILNFFFYRQGAFNESSTQQVSKELAGRLSKECSAWFKEQLSIYNEDLKAYTISHPQEVLRAHYIDTCGQLPLPASEETFPIRDLFTHLTLIQAPTTEAEEELTTSELPERDTLFETQERMRMDSPSIDLNRLFNKRNYWEKESVRKVLLLGRAGIGKSTLCQKISHDWASKKLWKDRFTSIYWLPLRELNPLIEGEGLLASITDDDEWLAVAISHLIYEDQRFKSSILADLQKNPQTTLILFDGYDEASPALVQALSPYLQDNELSILFTSRPGVTHTLHAFIEKTVENIGFSKHQITQYANKLFQLKRVNERILDQESDRFIKTLSSQKNLFAVAHIPLQLQMLCVLWDKGADKKGFPKTLTALYKAMVTQLFHWQARKEKQDPLAISGERTKMLLTTLGDLALKGLEHGKLVLSYSLVDPHLADSTVSEKDLLTTGLLRARGDAPYRDYTFLHLTFQEYLIAYAVSQKPPEEQLNFVRSYRYKPQFKIMISFLAGLTSAESPEKAKGFFKALHHSPGDFGGFYQLELTLYAMNECSDLFLHQWIEKTYHPCAALLDYIDVSCQKNQSGHFQWGLDLLTDKHHLRQEEIIDKSFDVMIKHLGTKSFAKIKPYFSKLLEKNSQETSKTLLKLLPFLKNKISRIRADALETIKPLIESSSEREKCWDFISKEMEKAKPAIRTTFLDLILFLIEKGEVKEDPKSLILSGVHETKENAIRAIEIAIKLTSKDMYLNTAREIIFKGLERKELEVRTKAFKGLEAFVDKAEKEQRKEIWKTIMQKAKKPHLDDVIPVAERLIQGMEKEETSLAWEFTMKGMDANPPLRLYSFQYLPSKIFAKTGDRSAAWNFASTWLENKNPNVRKKAFELIGKLVKEGSPQEREKGWEIVLAEEEKKLNFELYSLAAQLIEGLQEEEKPLFWQVIAKTMREADGYEKGRWMSLIDKVIEKGEAKDRQSAWKMVFDWLNDPKVANQEKALELVSKFIEKRVDQEEIKQVIVDKIRKKGDPLRSKAFDLMLKWVDNEEKAETAWDVVFELIEDHSQQEKALNFANDLMRKEKETSVESLKKLIIAGLKSPSPKVQNGAFYLINRLMQKDRALGWEIINERIKGKRLNVKNKILCAFCCKLDGIKEEEREKVWSILKEGMKSQKGEIKSSILSFVSYKLMHEIKVEERNSAWEILFLGLEDSKQEYWAESLLDELAIGEPSSSGWNIVDRYLTHESFLLRKYTIDLAKKLAEKGDLEDKRKGWKVFIHGLEDQDNNIQKHVLSLLFYSSLRGKISLEDKKEELWPLLKTFLKGENIDLKKDAFNLIDQLLRKKDPEDLKKGWESAFGVLQREKELSIQDLALELISNHLISSIDQEKRRVLWKVLHDLFKQRIQSIEPESAKQKESSEYRYYSLFSNMEKLVEHLHERERKQAWEIVFEGIKRPKISRGVLDLVEHLCRSGSSEDRKQAWEVVFEEIKHSKMSYGALNLAQRLLRQGNAEDRKQGWSLINEQRSFVGNEAFTLVSMMATQGDRKEVWEFIDCEWQKKDSNVRQKALELAGNLSNESKREEMEKSLDFLFFGLQDREKVIRSQALTILIRLIKKENGEINHQLWNRIDKNIQASNPSVRIAVFKLIYHLAAKGERKKSWEALMIGVKESDFQVRQEVDLLLNYLMADASEEEKRKFSPLLAKEIHKVKPTKLKQQIHLSNTLELIPMKSYITQTPFTEGSCEKYFDQLRRRHSPLYIGGKESGVELIESNRTVQRQLLPEEMKNIKDYTMNKHPLKQYISHYVNAESSDFKSVIDFLNGSYGKSWRIEEKPTEIILYKEALKEEDKNHFSRLRDKLESLDEQLNSDIEIVLKRREGKLLIKGQQKEVKILLKKICTD